MTREKHALRHHRPNRWHPSPRSRLGHLFTRCHFLCLRNTTDSESGSDIQQESLIDNWREQDHVQHYDDNNADQNQVVHNHQNNLSAGLVESTADTSNANNDHASTCGNNLVFPISSGELNSRMAARASELLRNQNAFLNNETPQRLPPDNAIYLPEVEQERVSTLGHDSMPGTLPRSEIFGFIQNPYLSSNNDTPTSTFNHSSHSTPDTLDSVNQRIGNAAETELLNLNIALSRQNNNCQLDVNWVPRWMELVAQSRTTNHVPPSRNTPNIGHQSNETDNSARSSSSSGSNRTQLQQNWYIYDSRLLPQNRVQRIESETRYRGVHNRVSMPGVLEPPPYEEHPPQVDFDDIPDGMTLNANNTEAETTSTTDLPPPYSEMDPNPTPEETGFPLHDLFIPSLAHLRPPAIDDFAPTPGNDIDMSDNDNSSDGQDTFDINDLPRTNPIVSASENASGRSIQERLTNSPTEEGSPPPNPPFLGHGAFAGARLPMSWGGNSNGLASHRPASMSWLMP